MKRVRPLIILLLLHGPALADEHKSPAAQQVLLGQDTSYSPVGFTTGLQLRGRMDQMQGFELDRYGTRFGHDPALNTQLRLSLRYDSGKTLLPFIWGAEYEHDLYSGVVRGGNTTLGTQDAPDSGGYDTHQLRKASLRASLGNRLTLAVGFMTSHWGMGLLANDGAHGWTPTSAYFSDPRGGDRVLRALIATGPYVQGLVVFAAVDRVVGDDATLDGDTARQAVLGLKMGDGKPYRAGLYAVHRRQRASDGDETVVNVVDGYGSYRMSVGAGWALHLESEVALILGQTDLGASPDAAQHQVMQLAGALRADFKASMGGVGITAMFASGDNNRGDDKQNAFKADPNFDMGMLLFPYVLAAQSARAPVTAANLDLVGVPAQDRERIPTRGSVTNTLAFFPRAWIRPLDGLEFYGGVLMALSNVDYADPFNTRLAGGDPRNALDKVPGAYYGTEFDLGVRYSALLWGTTLELGLEGAMLLPGSALGLTDTLLGGRAMAAYRF